MKQQKTIAVFLGLILLALPLISVIPSIVLSSSQTSSHRFDARGGIPGPPSKEPPPEEPIPSTIEYELFVEIDYMAGHEPTSEVLAYVYNYYYDRGIEIIFEVDDQVEDPTPYTGITDLDFSQIEALNNDHDFGSFSKWKWVLFGSTVEGEPDVAGYIAEVWINIKYNVRSGRIRSVDCLAGNYIFIADETTDQWATTLELEIGAEAVVLMHELGHSIGIVKVGWTGNYYHGFVLYEVYDSDSGSVMAMLSTANVGQYGTWYYSDEYWALKNLEYYEI